jgi:hypothetical protein
MPIPGVVHDGLKSRPNNSSAGAAFLMVVQFRPSRISPTKNPTKTNATVKEYHHPDSQYGMPWACRG